MPLQTHDNRRLYRHIADQLMQMIGSGEYPPGARLPAERDLAIQLGVSRPSVREALIALEVEGAVEVRGGAGVFVLPQQRRGAPIDPLAPVPGPFDLIRARWIVESECANLAATHATPEQLAAMKRALDDMRGSPSHNDASLEADQRFHLCISEASANSALVMVTRQLWDARRGPLYLQLESHFSGKEIWRQAVDEHAEILNAIVSRDGVAARNAMRRHMKNAELRFASNWRSEEST
ncbi:MAG TPA: FadR/GntR family transcriptional regulator [Rhizobacter sp.]|nr:FadR/GntR family transcriptional regulator [Rhizobacter sp.]